MKLTVIYRHYLNGREFTVAFDLGCDEENNRAALVEAWRNNARIVSSLRNSQESVK